MVQTDASWLAVLTGLSQYNSVQYTERHILMYCHDLVSMHTTAFYTCNKYNTALFCNKGHGHYLE